MNPKEIAVTGFVKGRVQGVFFRAETQKTAQQLKLRGWCRNTADGHVEVLLAGAPEQLNEMQQWLAKGPQLANVQSVELWE